MQAYRREEPFELPVVYKGRELLLPARLVKTGYTYRIYVLAAEQEIIFEPDEERNFRAMVENGTGGNVPAELLQVIVEALEQNFR